MLSCLPPLRHRMACMEKEALGQRMTRQYSKTGKRNSCAISYGADGRVVRAGQESKGLGYPDGRRLPRRHNAIGGPVVARIKVGICQEDAEFLRDFCSENDMIVSEAVRSAIEILRCYCQNKPMPLDLKVDIFE